ncbi:hypothetical protein GCM10023184_45460 [Flaviaesturariibacter amylovorans]|uniref:VIT domain-containing protein n=1 Tax=Flaviaesturariibacter amylovorans TaxID=1084520 RepID=A0ABP8HTZ7_9BACT
MCAWLALGSCADVAKVHQSVPGTLPMLQVAHDSGSRSLRLSRLLVHVQVTGHIATTTYDITFYNDQDKLLEGEFDFPLADGQSISRYALEIDDKLREGVVVEKAKARVAFEQTVRGQIDPGLVEKTKGNHFRTRIYPIPARGYKRVLIGIEEALPASATGLAYALPLAAGHPLDQFSVTATVALPAARPRVVAGDGFAFRSGDAGWEASLQRENYQPTNGLAFNIPLGQEAPLVYTEARGKETYFYAYLPADSALRARALPRSLTLFWDVSASAAQRNTEKEIALLRSYLSAIGNVRVTVVPFAVRTFSESVFTVRNGDAAALIAHLEKTAANDGGTQLGALDLQRFPADEHWLLTDGISTFGEKEVRLSATPVTVVSSSPGADFSYLKYIARQSGGRFVDLGAAEPEAAAVQLVHEYRQFLGADYDAGAIDSLVTPVQSGVSRGFAVAGILKRDTATLTLHFGFGSTRSSRQTVLLRREQAPAPGVGRIWAGMQINELDLRPEANKEAITRLGKQFSIVTRNTSLLVLDRVEDYVTHEILPPADLLPEYLALMKEKKSVAQDRRKEGVAAAETAMQELVAWWQAPPRKERPADAQVETGTRFTPPVISDAAVVADSTTTAAAANAVPTPARPHEPMLNYTQDAKVEEVQLEAVSLDRVELSKVAEPSSTVAASAIEVQQWKADAPYLAELEATAPADRFERYRALKTRYARQPSFYVDVARFFFAQNEEAIAVQVLSNIAELRLEDPELLRVMAEQLQEFGQQALALATYRELLELREEEPQAYRDLALACSAAGDHNKAVHLLYQVATGDWDDRFAGIRQVALSEMNALIGIHGKAIDLTGIDPRFVRAMPVDVRIVIGWSADNSDIDLWVTDPRGEKCSYENTGTALGGRISRDATQGYGPEEFLLRKAGGGAYEIEANLFGDSRQTLGGPITIKAELFTDFGRPNQRRKVISLRLTDQKEVVRIGKLVFGNS